VRTDRKKRAVAKMVKANGWLGGNVKRLAPMATRIAAGETGQVNPISRRAPDRKVPHHSLNGAKELN